VLFAKGLSQVHFTLNDGGDVVSNLIVAVTQVGKVGAVSGLVVVFTYRKETNERVMILPSASLSTKTGGMERWW
jgi:hypothetical protein